MLATVSRVQQGLCEKSATPYILVHTGRDPQLDGDMSGKFRPGIYKQDSKLPKRDREIATRARAPSGQVGTMYLVCVGWSVTGAPLLALSASTREHTCTR